MSSPDIPLSVCLGIGAFAALMYLRSRDISRRMDEQFDEFVRTDAILTKALENYTNDLRLLRTGRDSSAPKDSDSSAPEDRTRAPKDHVNSTIPFNDFNPFQ